MKHVRYILPQSWMTRRRQEGRGGAGRGSATGRSRARRNGLHATPGGPAACERKKCRIYSRRESAMSEARRYAVFSVGRVLRYALVARTRRWGLARGARGARFGARSYFTCLTGTRMRTLAGHAEPAVARRGGAAGRAAASRGRPGAADPDRPDRG